VNRATIVFAAGCMLYACADAPATREPVLSAPVSVGPVTITYTTQASAHAECERRMRNGKPHWGCATYSAAGCDIVVGDVDRSAVLGVEIMNCVRMAGARP
jgi:hypothetical protein